MKYRGLGAANAGVSMVEVLIVVGLLGVVAAVSVVVGTNVREKVAHEKLAGDVRHLNAAVRLYQMSGGSLGAISDPAMVINTLKTTVTAADRESMVGLSGRFVDVRLHPVFMTPKEIQSNAPRAIWNSETNHFEIWKDNSAKGPAVKRFSVIEDSEATKALNRRWASREESRPQTTMSFARDSDWIWDYADSSIAAAKSKSKSGSSPTDVGLNSGMAVAMAGAGFGMDRFDPPLFSISGGRQPLSSYDLSLNLVNPNDPAISTIHYSTSLGAWQEYAGPIAVTPKTKIVAFVKSTDPVNWLNSIFDAKTYTVRAEQLVLNFTAPDTMTYAEAGGMMMPGGSVSSPAGPARLTLGNSAAIPAAYQSSALFNVYWTYDGSDPAAPGSEAIDGQAGGGSSSVFGGDAFSGGFPGQDVDVALAKWGTRSALPMRAVAKSTNHDFVTDSAEVSRTVAIAPTDLRAPMIEVEHKGNGVGVYEVTITPVTEFGDTPAGARIFYSTDGTDPGENNGGPQSGKLYTGPFKINSGSDGDDDKDKDVKDPKDPKDPKEPKASKTPKTPKAPKKVKKAKTPKSPKAPKKVKSRTVATRVYGPSGFEPWFRVSPSSSKKVKFDK